MTIHIYLNYKYPINLVNVLSRLAFVDRWRRVFKTLPNIYNGTLLWQSFWSLSNFTKKLSIIDVWQDPLNAPLFNQVLVKTEK